MSEVYDRYVDTAGNYHYTDVETGHHVIRKSYGCDNCRYRSFPATRSPCDNCLMSGDNYSEWTAPTNADRIRSMTDEELCDEYFRILNYQLYNYTDSRAGLLCWLKEEVKDGE